MVQTGRHPVAAQNPKKENMMKKELSRMAKTAVAITAGVMMAATVQAGQTYKLGLSLAITGPTSDAGQPYSKGAEDYVKFANDQKLLGDDKVECTIRDDQYQNDNTKRNFEDYNAAGIVLYLNYSTGSTLALKKDFEEVKIPVIPASFHAGNLIDSTMIFLPVLSYSGQVIGLGEYVANNTKDKAKVALFVHPSAFGRGPVDDFKKAIEKGLNVELVEVVEHAKDLDNTAMLQRLQSKGVQFVLCQTVQSPVATLLKDAGRLNVSAKSFGEAGKITFLGAHYTGGNDLIALAGENAENFFWTTSYKLTSVPGPGTDFQLKMAKTYGRDDQTANSHNYTNGMMVVQVAVEAIKRAKAKGEVTRESITDALNAMNGANSYDPGTTVGPVSYSTTDHEGVDSLQLYRATKGVFTAVGAPFKPAFYKK